MGISMKLCLFLVFLLSLFFIFMCETCVGDRNSFFTRKLNTKPRSQAMLTFWCEGRRIPPYQKGKRPWELGY